MTNMQVITAVNGYQKSTSRLVDIPTNLYACNFREQPLCVSFIGEFVHRHPNMKKFVDKWADSKLDPGEMDELRGYCSQTDKDKLLSALVQGTLEVIPRSKWAEPGIIQKANTDFSIWLLKRIYTTEELVWQLLNRGKFIPQKGGGLLSFQQYLTLLQDKDPGLNLNSLALFANIDRYIMEDGTSQLKAEYIERMKELQCAIRKSA